MTKLAFQGCWHAVKGRLRQRYARLAHDNLLFALGQHEELLGRCQQQAAAMKTRLRGYLTTLPRYRRLHLQKTMKKILLLLPFALFTLTALPACREKTTGEKIGDKIDDALDQRPGEKIRDAVEDAKK